MKATEQDFPVVLFIMLYKVALTFESMDEILKCDNSNKAIEQYFSVLFIIFASCFKHLSLLAKSYNVTIHMRLNCFL